MCYMKRQYRRRGNEIFSLFSFVRRWNRTRGVYTLKEETIFRALEQNQDTIQFLDDQKKNLQRWRRKWKDEESGLTGWRRGKRLWNFEIFLMINRLNFHLTRVLMFNIIRTSTTSSSNITKSFIISNKSIVVVGCCLCYPPRLSWVWREEGGGKMIKLPNLIFRKISVTGCVWVHKSISSFCVLYL